jgi:HAMP domain-containing protein
MAAFVTLCFVMLYGYIHSLVYDAAEERASCMSKTLVRSTTYDMLKGDHMALRHLVSNMGSNSNIEHLRIFDKQGTVRFANDSDEIGMTLDLDSEGCNVCHNETVILEPSTDERIRYFEDPSGQKVLGLTVPIPKQKGCVTAECHPGSEDVALLGTVDVGVSMGGVEQALSRVLKGLSGVWLLVVVLAIGLLSVVIQRNVLLPVNRLIEYAKQVDHGIIDDERQPDDCYEFRYLASLIRRLGVHLRDAKKK